MARLPLALLLAVCALGCVDFDRFQFQRDAAGDPMDAAAPDIPDPVDALDATVEPPTPDAPPDPPPDHGPDVPQGCQPGRAATTQLRVAHMAPEVGPIDICMQKRGRSPTTSMTRLQSTLWPSDGLDYGEVSQSVPLNEAVTSANEAWDIAVVERGTACERVPMDVTPLATRSIQLDPGTLRLLVITAEPALDGHLVPFFNLLADENCTDCMSNTVDVRAVHAALGASGQRLTFTVLPQSGLETSPAVAAMRTFATGVSYGGDQGYACNQAWGSFIGPPLRLMVPVQFEASTAAGRLIARSETVAIKYSYLSRRRTVTVFFEGAFSEDGAPGPQAPGFVVCYDGLELSNEKYEFFKVIQDYLAKAARVVSLDPAVETMLSQPKNELIVHFPVRWTTGRGEALQGLPHPAQQHPRALQGRHPLPRERHPRRRQGPRRDDDVEVRADGLPYGGAKGGVKFNPRAHSPASCSASRGASRTRSAATSAPTTTSPRPTWAPTRR
jgi:hypothetical protein